jgi:hypothetical protein
LRAVTALFETGNLKWLTLYKTELTKASIIRVFWVRCTYLYPNTKPSIHLNFLKFSHGTFAQSQGATEVTFIEINKSFKFYSINYRHCVRMWSISHKRMKEDEYFNVNPQFEVKIGIVLKSALFKIKLSLTPVLHKILSFRRKNWKNLEQIWLQPKG